MRVSFKKPKSPTCQKRAMKLKTGFMAMVKTFPKVRNSQNGVSLTLFLDAYVERKTNLDAVIAPIKHRLTEFEGRKSAFESLTNVLNVYQKVCFFYFMKKWQTYTAILILDCR